MARYIDADALNAYIESAECNSVGKALQAIDNAPTISPDEVHGNWVGIDDFPYESWECDRCGCVVENTDDPWNYFHYCPNCGAKMFSSPLMRTGTGSGASNRKLICLNL